MGRLRKWGRSAWVTNRLVINRLFVSGFDFHHSGFALHDVRWGKTGGGPLPLWVYRDSPPTETAARETTRLSVGRLRCSYP